MTSEVFRASLWVFCAILVFLCAWLVFTLIDLSVTIDHQAQNLKVIEGQNKLLVGFLDEVSRGMPESQVRDLLRRASDQMLFEKGEGHVVADQVSFFFRDGKLVRVSDR